MYAVSDAYKAMVRGSHTIRTKVEVKQGTADWVTIQILEGEVTVNIDSPVARTVRFVVSPTAVNAFGRRLDANGWQIYSTFVRISRGVVFDENNVEYVPLGTFMLDNVSRTYTAQGQALEVTGSDLYTAVQRNRLLRPQTFPNQSHLDFVKNRIRGALNANYKTIFPNGVQFQVLDPTGELKNGTLTKPKIERARDEVINNVLKAMGGVGYFNGQNTYVIRYMPQSVKGLVNQTEWKATQGENGVVIDLSQSITREGVYNAVVAIGEHENPDVKMYTGIAVDKAAGSPTHWDGPFGRVPAFYTSKYLTSQDIANSVAKGLLKRAKVVHKRIELTLLPDCSLEPGDKVNILFPGQETVADVWETHCLTAITYPLMATDTLKCTSALMSISSIDFSSTKGGSPWITS